MRADEIVKAGHDAIADRAAGRDDGGERSMARTVRIFNAAAGRNLAERDGWLGMICLKIARAQQGEPRADDYIDLAGYAGLLGECAIADTGRD